MDMCVYLCSSLDMLTAVYRQIKNVDVYDLILEHGYLGALEYSNLIDSKNTKLASEIDQIVYGFIKSAQAFAPDSARVAASRVQALCRGRPHTP